MSPFARHKITHLSASSLNKWRAEPAAWIVQYLMGIRDNAGPGAWRGSAVEAGLNTYLAGTDLMDPIDAMFGTFERDAMGEASDEVEKERACLPAMLKQAKLAFADRKCPVAMQMKVECWLDGIEIPIIGYADYVWPEYGDDLKTTFRVPSSIESASTAHKRQAAIYMRARKQPWFLTYVSDKKWARYEVTEAIADEAIRDLTRIARSLREVLRRSETAEDAAALFAPDYDSFYWSAVTKDAAASVNAWRLA